MSKHEIRLRKQKLTAGTGSDRYRNFSILQKRHERELRMKKIIRIFTIVAALLIIAILVIAMQLVLEMRKNEAKGKSPARTGMVEEKKAVAPTSTLTKPKP